MITVRGAQATLVAAMARATPNPIIGASALKSAQALSEAMVTWAVAKPMNLGLTGVATGVPGTGTISFLSTKITVPDNQDLARQAAAPFLKGPIGTSLASAIAIWTSVLFSTQGQYQGTSALVGIGTDSSVFSTINIVALEKELAGRLGGPGAFITASGVAAAVFVVLANGSGVGTVAGAGGGLPITGPTTSFVL